ncbi:MAG: hypothetical protein MUP63_00040 [Candidatus Nanohaloarchaeota archaeon QJJ-7]|nr:hypothetical protein [Candidatus Nanohaloarchaeota archaeon QJJ-7]
MTDLEDEDEPIEFENGQNPPPLFENEDHGVTAWAEEDKNGNFFLRIRLPLGLGTVPLFVNDSGYDNIHDAFNRLVEHVQD